MILFRFFLLLLPAGTYLVLFTSLSNFACGPFRKNKKEYFFLFCTVMGVFVSLLGFLINGDVAYLMTIRDLMLWSFLIMFFIVGENGLRNFYESFSNFFLYAIFISVIFYVSDLEGFYYFDGWWAPGSYIDYIINNGFFSDAYFLGGEWRRFNSFFLYATSAGWAISLLSLIYLNKALEAKDSASFIKMLIAYFFLAALVISTASRTSIFLLAIFSFYFFSIHSNRSLFSLFMMFSCIVVLPLFFYFMLDLVGERPGSASSRLLIYRESIQYVARNPVGYFRTMPIAGHVLDAGTHSTYLSVALKFGVLGISVLLSSVFYMIWSLCKVKNWTGVVFVFFLFVVGLVEELTLDPLAVLVLCYLVCYIKLDDSMKHLERFSKP